MVYCWYFIFDSQTLKSVQWPHMENHYDSHMILGTKVILIFCLWDPLKVCRGLTSLSFLAFETPKVCRGLTSLSFLAFETSKVCRGLTSLSFLAFETPLKSVEGWRHYLFWHSRPLKVCRRLWGHMENSDGSHIILGTKVILIFCLWDPLKSAEGWRHYLFYLWDPLKVCRGLTSLSFLVLETP